MHGARLSRSTDIGYAIGSIGTAAFATVPGLLLLYYLTNVLFTQYFTPDGASIHYNYWSSNWGYAGSHGCLGVAYNEAKFAWDWADVGTPVYVFT